MQLQAIQCVLETKSLAWLHLSIQFLCTMKRRADAKRTVAVAQCPRETALIACHLPEHKPPVTVE